MRVLKISVVVLLGVSVAAAPKSSSATERAAEAPPNSIDVPIDDWNGGSGGPVEVSVDDPTVQAFASYLDVPPETAAELLAVQQEAGRVEDRLAAAFPDTYGGRWWSFEENRAKFGVIADVGAAAKLVSESPRAASMDVVEVKYTLAQLEAASHFLGAIIEEAGLTGIEAAVKTNLNSVVIGVPPPQERTPEQQRILDDAVLKYGEMITTEPLPAGWKVVPTACGTGSWEDFCDPPLRGGVGFSHSGGLCTSGFIAQSRIDTKRYVVTAGHCRNGTDPAQFASRQANGTIRNVGPWHNGNPGAPDDWAIVQITSSYWTTDNIVFVRANPSPPYPTTRNEAYTITADSNSAAGDFVCYSGRTTNTACGSVEATGIGGGQGAVRASYCIQPGDSGGPVYRLHTAYGTNYAHGSVDGVCKSYYVEIRDAENALNVNVLLS